MGERRGQSHGTCPFLYIISNTLFFFGFVHSTPPDSEKVTLKRGNSLSNLSYLSPKITLYSTITNQNSTAFLAVCVSRSRIPLVYDDSVPDPILGDQWEHSGKPGQSLACSLSIGTPIAAGKSQREAEQQFLLLLLSYPASAPADRQSQTRACSCRRWPALPARPRRNAQTAHAVSRIRFSARA